MIKQPASRPRILTNAASYGFLQFLQYLAPLITIPLLTRALGTDQFGILVLSTLVGGYVGLFIDFGFNVTANREVATVAHNSVALDRTYWEVQATRAVLALFGSTCVATGALLLTKQSTAIPVLIATLGSATGSLLLPLWYFEGQQRLREVAAALASARVFQVGAILLFVHKPQDLWVAVLAEASVNITAGAILIHKQPSAAGCMELITTSGILHRLSTNFRLASGNFSVSFYTSAHTAILAIFAPASAVGLFALADRAIAAGKAALRPLTSAIFPHLVATATRDRAAYEQERRFYSLMLLTIGFLSSIALFALSDLLVRILAGDEFAPSAKLLRWMSPIPACVALSNAFGVQTLLTLGRDRLFSTILMTVAAVGTIFSFALASLYGASGSAIAAVGSEALASVLMGVAAAFVLKDPRR